MRRELHLPESFRDLPLLAQYYVTNVKRNGRKRLDMHLREPLLELSKEQTFAENHRLIAELQVPEVWTTNYDRMLENAIGEDVVVCTHDDDVVTKLRGAPPDRKVVVKMHGEFRHPSQRKSTHEPAVIITREDFETYPRTHPRMWARLSAIFATESILFLGVSFSDPNQLVLLALARQSWGAAQRQHFTVMRRPSNAEEQRVHEYRMRDLETAGIRAVEVQDHDEITNLLGQLVVSSIRRRVFVSGSDDAERSGNTGLIESICKRVGIGLGRADIPMLSGSAQPGLIVAMALGEQLKKDRKYDPDKMISYHQSNIGPPTTHGGRFGTVKYYGDSKAEKRKEMIRQASVTFVVGGGQGTRDEVEMSKKQLVPVVPLGCSGGTAKVEWSRMLANLENETYGGQPIEEQLFADLGSTSEVVASAASLRLLKQAMYMGES